MSYNKENQTTVCKECGKSHESLRSLHAHLKIHKTFMGDYYVKHFPRKSVYTGDLLPFKSLDQYMSSYFANIKEEEAWLKEAPLERVKKYCLVQYQEYKKIKNKKSAPYYNEVATRKLPSVETCAKAFGSYGLFCKSLGLEPTFKKGLTKDFWTADTSALRVMIDTREQQPFVIENSFKSKIDVGDYAATGDHYDYTYVDRKAQGDFISTLSKSSFERFRREMERCRNLDVQLYIVVEGSIEDIRNRKAYKRNQASVEHTFHNMRLIQEEFSDVCQFVFARDRDDAADITKRILFFGKKIWGVDMQYYVNNRKF